MPRDLPLSNGKLLVCFDLEYRIRDVFYPHVGQENHSGGHLFRFGIWADGAFSWMGADWKPEMRYVPESMVSAVRARNETLGIELECTDGVDFYENVLIRHIRVKNLRPTARDIRVFFHHDFRIKETGVGDTALYSPEAQALVHYKDDRYFLINCASGRSVGVTQFACGLKEVNAAEGTWRDAEDGTLSGNPIAQGSVDSTLGVTLPVGPQETGELFYWMAAGTDFREVSTINSVVRDKTPAELLRRTRSYWRLWARKDRRAHGELSELVLDRYKQSLLIIYSQIDHAGAVLAANDSDITQFARDTYSYMWPRDGALVSAALLRSGHTGAPERFLRFCARVISDNGYVRHKYNPDGTLASSWHGYVRDGKPVLPIQEDETALIIWALWIYFEMYQRIEETAPLYRSLVTHPADFLLQYVDPTTGLPLPSHDLWEERWGVHAYTVAAVIAGLRAAARLCDAFGEEGRAVRYRAGADRMLESVRRTFWNEKERRFARMVSPGPTGYTQDLTLDSSLFGLVEFGALDPDDPQVASTYQQIEERLWVNTDVGGLARYENDYYQQRETKDTKRVPGNPWFISTLWLARYHLLRAKTPVQASRGRELIEWAAQHALPSGVMAEQLHPYTGEPLSVSPLTWSHAAYVRAVREYSDRSARMQVCPQCGQPVKRLPRLTEKLTVVTPGRTGTEVKK
ncbi:MAG: glycoside hydrolase family 15 protein [Gemmatimonadetes bacterium]|nr:glycoside hydrolase family 15 protein [Gemmatimonadota bacterium]